MIRNRHVCVQPLKIGFFLVAAAAASVLTSIQGHVLEFAVEPSDTVVESGRSAVLDCVAKTSIDYPSSVLTVHWLDQDRQPLTFIGDNYRSQLTNGSLYISSVLEEQELTGTYQCKATLPNIGSIVSRTAELKLATLSGFRQEPRDITVHPGQKAHFACKVQASPTIRIRWLKDERPLQLDELRMTILPSGALEIDEVTDSDQGSYRCNVSGMNSYILSNKASLTIKNNEQPHVLSPPNFIALPQPQVTVEGQTITFDCAANGNPRPTIKWLKDGHNIDMADLDSRFSSVGSTTSLQIKNVQEFDAGTYQCRAENREDSVDATALLQVQVPPKFLKRPQDKIESINKDVQLECNVYGKPEPKVIWLKNGEIIKVSEYYQIVSGNNLRILGLMLPDSGLFQCVASNPGGNIQASASLKVIDTGDNADSDAERVLVGYPGAPQDLKATIVKARFVTLSWRAPAVTNGDIIAYSVYHRQEGSERERVQNTTRSRLEDINVGGLQPARVYFFRVVAFNALGSGASSKTLKIQTQAEEHVPSAPQNVVAYATGTRSIHVNWETPESSNGNILRYNIYYMEVTSSVEHNIETINLESDLVGLSIYTEYIIWIVAVNDNGAGAASEERTVRTYGDVPSEAPYNVTLEPSSSSSIVVRWEPPPPDGQNGIITGYKLRYRKQGKKGDTITTPANLRIYPLNNLERASIYQVKLWAINANGTGPATDWYEVETYVNDLDETKVPEQPSSLKVRPSSDKIFVMWNPPQNQNIKIRNYIIGWGKGVPDNFSEALDEKQRTYTITGVEPNSEYVLSLRASNDIGAGIPVYEYVRTRDEPPPEPITPLIPPVGLKAQVLTSTSVVLYWTDTTLGKSQYVRDNRFYTVKCTADGNSRSKYFNITDLYVQIDDLKPNTLYEFTVKLVKGRRESPWSMVVQNTTWETAPSTSPRDLHIVPIEDNAQMVELQWQPPKVQNGQITGYVILYTKDSSKRDREWSAQAVKDDIHTDVINGLEATTTYYFKIQARNSRGYGPFSPIVSFRTGLNTGNALARSSHKESRSTFDNPILLYSLAVACLVGTCTVFAVILILCRRRCKDNPSPQTIKKGYQKGSSQQIKPPDLWIHHDQMELKALEKSHANNDGASGSGVMTLPRNIGASEYDDHNPHHSNSLDKRTYVPNYMDDNNKRLMKPKSIALPTDAPLVNEPIATATPINTSSMSQTSTDSTPSNRSAYPRTQYSLSRAHVTMDPNAAPNQVIESPYVSHPHTSYDPNVPNTSYVSHQVPAVAHAPPGSTYAPGMSVLAESQCGKRLQGQGHPLKSFSVPAPPPISAPGTPQAKHMLPSQAQVTIRPTSSPYKKSPYTTVNTMLASTSPSRINASHPPPYTMEEVQPLQPSHSTEKLKQEMENLDDIMQTLKAIRANEFEC